MPATLSTVASLLKEVYQGRLQSQLQNETVAIQRIERTSEGVESQVGGKYVTFPLKVRRNPAIGYRNEMEQLQSAGQAGYASVRVPLRYGYGRLRLSGQLIDLANSNYQAFASAMDEEMKGLKEDIAKDVNRIVYGDGLGTLASFTSGGAPAAGNTVTVTNTQYLEVGFQVDVITADGNTTLASNRQVTAINVGTGVVTLDGAAFTPAATTAYVLVRTGNYGREPQGFKSIVKDTGVLQNLDPATEPKWAAIVDSNGGATRALSENLWIKNVDAARRNGGQTSAIFTSLGVRRAYFGLLQQQRRYPSTTDFAGGYKGLAFNSGREIPVVEDVDAPPSTAYGLDESTFKVYRDADWSWMDRDGTTFKWVHDFDAYEAILKQYWEFATNRRNANWVVQDITEA